MEDGGIGCRSLAILHPLSSILHPFSILLALLLLACVPTPTHAQDIPRDTEAELVFEQGVEAFEANDFGMAYRRFRLVYERYPLNRKTTAALFMAGQAAYREGDYDRARRVLRGLLDTFPTTTYAAAARETLAHADAADAAAAAAPRVADLGVALPLRAGDAGLTQALFNGLRVAVEAHNASEPDVLVRMVFRDSRGTADGAAAAVSALAGEGVTTVLGPLYSEEAVAAGQAAERARVVLMAPLATDEAVSDDRRFVFQANPTFAMRGRQMARFAADNLRLADFGVVAELGEYGERMAEGFQEEALARGAEVRFFRLLEPGTGWNKLDAVLADLPDAEALYLPVTGARAAQSIREALVGVERAGRRPRVLGNAEWQGLNARARADLFGTTFTNDFYPDAEPQTAAAFERAYARLAGRTPEASVQRLAYAGYDVGTFLLSALTRADPDGGAGAVADALRRAPRYEGAGQRIDFAGGNVNEALFFMRYRAGGVDLLR